MPAGRRIATILMQCIGAIIAAALASVVFVLVWGGMTSATDVRAVCPGNGSPCYVTNRYTALIPGHPMLPVHMNTFLITVDGQSVLGLEPDADSQPPGISATEKVLSAQAVEDGEEIAFLYNSDEHPITNGSSITVILYGDGDNFLNNGTISRTVDVTTS
jgi:hypothetical protein